MKADRQVKGPKISRSAQNDNRGKAAAQADMPQGVRYMGGGEFVPGVPARDLTADEARAWATVLASPTGRRLYAAGSTEVKVEAEVEQGEADVI